MEPGISLTAFPQHLVLLPSCRISQNDTEVPAPSGRLAVSPVAGLIRWSILGPVCFMSECQRPLDEHYKAIMLVFSQLQFGVLQTFLTAKKQMDERGQDCEIEPGEVMEEELDYRSLVTVSDLKGICEELWDAVENLPAQGRQCYHFSKTVLFFFFNAEFQNGKGPTSYLLFLFSTSGLLYIFPFLHSDVSPTSFFHFPYLYLSLTFSYSSSLYFSFFSLLPLSFSSFTSSSYSLCPFSYFSSLFSFLPSFLLLSSFTFIVWSSVCSSHSFPLFLFFS